MANKGGVLASGSGTGGGGISGSVKGRKLGYPGEGKPYMQALTKNAGAQYCPLQHQVVCSGGKGMGNKGPAWKMDGRSSKKPSGPSIRAVVKPSNYKDHQRNGK